MVYLNCAKTATMRITAESSKTTKKRQEVEKMWEEHRLRSRNKSERWKEHEQCYRGANYEWTRKEQLRRFRGKAARERNRRVQQNLERINKSQKEGRYNERTEGDRKQKKKRKLRNDREKEREAGGSIEKKVNETEQHEAVLQPPRGPRHCQKEQTAGDGDSHEDTWWQTGAEKSWWLSVATQPWQNTVGPTYQPGVKQAACKTW